MKVLLVEDHRQYAELVREKLAEVFGFEVALSPEPDDASRRLRAQFFDVVVVDVLYRELSERYNVQRALARNSLSELEPYNLSGLSVLDAAARLPAPPAVVVWTSADANRALHLVLAYQDFGIRVYCSKESPWETIGRAINAAVQRQSFTDLSLQPFLPRSGLPPISTVLFRELKWRAIWRALAAGSQAHEVTAKMTYYDRQTIRKAMSPMAHELAVLNPRINPDKQQFNQLSSYATYHWEFFLDRAVFARYPH
jgi:DNA-binding NarL/FixJ family response regulator